MGGLIKPKELAKLSEYISQSYNRQDTSAPWSADSIVEKPRRVRIWFLNSDKTDNYTQNQ